ncbi:MAG TPA: hypothetical protein VIE67_09760 [Rudaea sp.]|jgi:hypothetical protein|uniref:hypothetical protein n=1 Tax=Rudaea sp. TaxID=2136325 RepID=UPI002F945A4E
MANVLKVTLVQTSSGWYVDVNESGDANHVKHGANTQTITWKLSGNAYKGSFVSFVWLPNPKPPSPFGPALPTPKKKHLKMSDLNDSAGTKGTWRYKLTIDVGGTKYFTPT